MSPGHILYYDRSKPRLRLETLRWSDDTLAEQRARELPELTTARERLERFVTIYLPTGTAHPEWLLWLQAWALGAEDPEVAAVTGALNARWAALPDLSAGECFTVAPIVALMFILGVYPQALITLFNNTVLHLVP